MREDLTNPNLMPTTPADVDTEAARATGTHKRKPIRRDYTSDRSAKAKPITRDYTSDRRKPKPKRDYTKTPVTHKKPRRKKVAAPRTIQNANRKVPTKKPGRTVDEEGSRSADKTRRYNDPQGRQEDDFRARRYDRREPSGPGMDPMLEQIIQQMMQRQGPSVMQPPMPGAGPMPGNIPPEQLIQMLRALGGR